MKTTRYAIDVRDGGYCMDAGASFEIKRHGADKTIQVVITDQVHYDTAAVLMGERNALALGAEMCSAARQAAQYYDHERNPGPSSRLGVDLPPVVWSEPPWYAEAIWDGKGRVDLHWAAPLGVVLMVAYDITAGADAGAWFDPESLMKAGGQLCAESRRCGSPEWGQQPTLPRHYLGKPTHREREGHDAHRKSRHAVQSRGDGLDRQGP